MVSRYLVKDCCLSERILGNALIEERDLDFNLKLTETILIELYHYTIKNHI